jgi:hypothetical protein
MSTETENGRQWAVISRQLAGGSFNHEWTRILLAAKRRKFKFEIWKAKS